MTVQSFASGLIAVLLGLVSAQTTSTEVGGKCEFDNPPVGGVGSFWDPTCARVGGLGCDADGKHEECRFCGGGDFVSVPCPPSSCQFPQQPYIPYYWDSECELGKVGCLADGIHTACRFCGDFPYSTVRCPEGAAAPPSVACAFDFSEPTIPVYWEPGCVMGMHGCNADGRNVQCRHCGQGAFSHIRCPGSQVCAFENIPTVPYYYEPSCHSGMLGCKADGVHDECRYCSEAPFESVQCPEPHKGLELCQSNIGHRPVPYFWDDSCEDGQLGCFADGIHAQCRFCGAGNYTEVPCPDAHSNNLRGSGKEVCPADKPEECVSGWGANSSKECYDPKAYQCLSTGHYAAKLCLVSEMLCGGECRSGDGTCCHGEYFPADAEVQCCVGYGACTRGCPTWTCPNSKKCPSLPESIAQDLGTKCYLQDDSDECCF